MYKQQFHSITLSEKCMYSINNNPPRDEAYTTLNVRPPTYQAMDTLHLGTFRQMYGSNTSTYKRLKKNNTKLSAYSGHERPCNGTINIQCQYKDSRWVSAKFYVVDVPGPAVVGLPTSELLNLDLQKLNASLKRCSHKIPSVEELNPRFANAKIFSKLDTKAGYWSIHLDEESQIMTTFHTPFGRYCWKRWPFGLSVSQDLFQAKMDQILEGLHGVASIADDIVVYGKDEEEHDRNLTALMERAAEAGMVVNSDKCIIKQNNISFFGNMYTDSGIKPDPAKIRDIQENANTTEQR